MAGLMEDRIGMATKHQITLRFRDEYAKASKKDKGVILDRMCETLGMGRSTASDSSPKGPKGHRNFIAISRV